jgi:hypothetical protein
LNIPPEKVEKLWSQFLKSERMERLLWFFSAMSIWYTNIIINKQFYKKK